MDERCQFVQRMVCADYKPLHNPSFLTGGSIPKPKYGVIGFGLRDPNFGGYPVGDLQYKTIGSPRAYAVSGCLEVVTHAIAFEYFHKSPASSGGLIANVATCKRRT